MQIVISKEMIVILRANHFGLDLFLYILIGIVEGSLILSQLSIVVLIIEVLGTQMSTLSCWISELL